MILSLKNTVADLYPEVSFTGIDLSPIQPEMVPPNAFFMVDDIEHEGGWDFPEDMFEYIHVRRVMFSLRNKKLLIERAYKSVTGQVDTFLSSVQQDAHTY